MKILLALLLATSTLAVSAEFRGGPEEQRPFLRLAISPHVESLSSVLRWADWVAEAKVLEVLEIHDEGADGVRLKVEFTRSLHGKPPAAPAELYYLEGWPARMPDGRVEAPIWTGSSLERNLKVGDVFLAIGQRESSLKRAEPLSAEQTIRELLAEH